MSLIDNYLSFFDPIISNNTINMYALWKEGREAYLNSDLEKSKKIENLISILKNSYLSCETCLGENVKFAYGGIGVVIHKDAEIHDFVSIGQNTTIGGGKAMRVKEGKRLYIPIIKHDTYIAAGSRIIGGIIVSEFSIIGMNSVLLTNTEPFSVFAGSPAKKIANITPENCLKYKSFFHRYKNFSNEAFKLIIQNMQKKSDFKAQEPYICDNLRDHIKNIQGHYQFGNFPIAYLGAQIDWFKNPYQDRNWQWALHAFQFLHHHYDQEGNLYPESINYIDTLIQNWLDNFHNPAVGIDNEFPWHDHATALRLDGVIKYYLALEKNDQLTAAHKHKIEIFVNLHCEKLSQDTFYSKFTNHGFDQAISLFHAASIFNYKTYQDIALTRFIDELQFAFTDEGVHVENSPGYHRGMIVNVLRSLEIIDHYSTLSNITFNLKEFLDNSVLFLIYMMRYDYLLSYIGDTAKYRININLDQHHDLKYYNIFKKLANRHNLDEKESLPLIKLYEKSGYFIYRSDWSDIKNATHIILKCGHLSNYHRQDDDLNILLSAGGEDWFIDSGLYSHNQKDPIRMYMRSAKAHNIPIFDEMPIIRSKDKIEKIPTITEDSTSKDIVASVTAKTYMYHNIMVRRRLSIYHDRHINIRDLISKKIKKHGYWLFHVPKDKNITIHNSHISIKGRHNTLILEPKFVYYKSDMTKGKSKHRVKVYQGWNDTFASIFSEALNKKIDSQVIVISGKEIDFADFKITIQPSID